MAIEPISAHLIPKLNAMQGISPRVTRIQHRIISLLNANDPIGMQHHAKALWHRDRIGLVLSGKPEEVMPVTVEFVPSLECNYNCPPCTYRSWKQRTIADIGHRKMSYEVMMTLLDRLEEADVRGLIFTGGGEPLKNPHTIDGLVYAAEKKFGLGLFTNGSLLDEAKIQRLANINMGFIRISFNSGDQDNYLKFHGLRNPAVFQKAQRNIRLLAKALYGSKTGFGLGVIVNEVNVDYMHTVAEFARQVHEQEKNSKLKTIVYRPVVNYGQIDRDLTKQILPDIAKKAIDNFEGVIKILQGYPVTPILATDYFLDASLGKIGVKREYKGCLGHPWAASIAYDGGVYLCSENDGNPDFLMGNLIFSTMREIWQSEQRQKAIQRIGTCPPTCKIHRTNLLLAALTQESGLDAKEIEQLQRFIDIIRNSGDPGGSDFI